MDGEAISNWDAKTGQLLSVTDSTGTTTYHYHPKTDALVGVDYPNGGSIRYERDSLNRVKKVIVKADKNAADAEVLKGEIKLYISESKHHTRVSGSRVNASK
ncbi:MAG: hypothetical protein ACM37W_16135 [Actinomycetota bacterium]